MHSNIIGQKIPMAKFHYSAMLKEFYCDMSALQHYHINPCSQLYNDSLDAGFVMVSHKTGVGVPFHLIGVQRDAEGDIRFWSFEPAQNAIQQHPKLSGITVNIMNT